MTQLTRHPQNAALSSAEIAAARSASRVLWLDLNELVKPRITTMVLLTVCIGFLYGVTDAHWSWLLLGGTLLGTAMACMGASILNQVIECDTDALMQRTQNRPLPMGRLRTFDALVIALALVTAGLVTIVLAANWLAAALLAATVGSYALLYTPLKRCSRLALAVGAVPGAAPPVIGYAAAAGMIRAEATVLFLIMFLWQLPHFLAISWLYREDYNRAGFPMLCVIDPTGNATFRQIIITCMLLLPAAVLPTVLGMSGAAYLMVAVLSSAMFLLFGVRLAIGRRRRDARALFFVSLVYLPVVFAVMLLDKI